MKFLDASGNWRATEALARTIAEERAKIERLGAALRERDVNLMCLVARVQF